MIDHRPADLVCTVAADIPLAELQAALAVNGQMLALDPPDPDRTSVGDVFDRGLFGPRAHRYGLPRDLLLGIRAELPDGAVVHGGGRVVKNVAGYDLPKLFTGACGRLGRLLELTVRLHPLPPSSASVVCEPSDPAPLLRLAPACVELVQTPAEQARMLVRFESPVAAELARDAVAITGGELVSDDEELWRIHRARQSGLHLWTCPPAESLQTAAERVADGAGVVVGRVARGLLFCDLDPPVVEPSPLELAVIGAMAGG